MALLWKRPIILRNLLIVATSYLRDYLQSAYVYGVATVSRIDQIIGLFCRISSLLEGSFAKETNDLKEPTNLATLYLRGFLQSAYVYGVATVSRIDKIIGLFCRI